MTNDDADGRTAGPDAPRFKALEIDVAFYQGLLDTPGLSEAEKEAFIGALWGVICAFVDLGFGINPVQKSGGEITKAERSQRVDAPNVIDLASTLNAIAGPAARPHAARDERIP